MSKKVRKIANRSSRLSRIESKTQVSTVGSTAVESFDESGELDSKTKIASTSVSEASESDDDSSESDVSDIDDALLPRKCARGIYTV